MCAGTNGNTRHAGLWEGQDGEVRERRAWCEMPKPREERGGRTRCDEAPKQTANGNYHAPTRMPRQTRLNPPAREGGVADNAASDMRCGNWMKKMTWVQCGLLF